MLNSIIKFHKSRNKNQKVAKPYTPFIRFYNFGRSFQTVTNSITKQESWLQNVVTIYTPQGARWCTHTPAMLKAEKSTKHKTKGTDRSAYPAEQQIVLLIPH